MTSSNGDFPSTNDMNNMNQAPVAGAPSGMPQQVSTAASPNAAKPTQNGFAPTTNVYQQPMYASNGYAPVAPESPMNTMPSNPAVAAIQKQKKLQLFQKLFAIIGLVVGALGLCLSWVQVPGINIAAEIAAVVGLALTVVSLIAFANIAGANKVLAIIGASVSAVALLVSMAVSAAAVISMQQIVDQTSMSLRETETTYKNEGQLNDAYVKIEGTNLIKIQTDRPVYAVHLRVENTSDKTADVSDMVNVKLIQNGKQLTGEPLEPTTVEPGDQNTADYLFSLDDQTSNVTVECTSYQPYPEQVKVMQTFAVSSGQPIDE
ncbi:hypothetical protein D2E26_1356 [Bifidobacterium dolichotidis]|uniref:DUF5067 domain-containing protein n=1 Tax=Bifidobacterium dolichotidis TaxID=2306976 RepID=A0A430FP06_9BIFI|nr:DUF5067 domain-containing protein [Bifidobacterium dolichotidis]RSX54556.1 hypothetical protein D2E26_1356 [Bifidobacterium dolichotidis]